MFNHVMIGATDIERARQFYDAVLGVLGAGPAIENENAQGFKRLFYIHAGNVFGVSQPIDGEPATGANGGTIGFKCHSREQVMEFHAVALQFGGTSIEAPPGLREGMFGGPMNLAYVRDPDGNKLCAVHRIKPGS